MSGNLNEQVVVSFFGSAEKCDSAAQALMNWDKANEDIKLGTIARLVQSEKGEVTTHDSEFEQQREEEGLHNLESGI